MCPHCGRAIDLSDPRLETLTPDQVRAWHRLRDEYHVSARISAAEIGDTIGVTRQQAYCYIHPLLRAGLLRAEPKREEGVYMVYVLV